MNTIKTFQRVTFNCSSAHTNPVSASVSHEAPRGNPTRADAQHESTVSPMNPSESPIPATRLLTRC